MCCAASGLAAAVEHAGDAGAPGEVFVDASAAPGGDGSLRRPFRELRQALGRGRIHLATGVYPAAVLLDGVEVVGGSAVVLSASPPEACLRTRGEVLLREVQIQGGAAGLRVETGRATLESVRFSGQRGPAVEVGSGAALVLSRSTVQASVSGLPGVRIQPGGRAVLRDVQLRGPFQRAIDADHPADLRLEGVQVADAVSGLALSGGEASLERVEVRGGRGPGIYVSGGTLHLRDVGVSGHEYGLLTGEGARVDGRGFRSTQAARAGLGLVRARASLADVQVDGAGQMAAVQAISSDVRLTSLVITSSRSNGLVSRDSRLVLERTQISGVRSEDRDEGDGLQLRGGTATVSGLRVQGCSGIGLLAAEGATVTLRQSSVSEAGVAGMSVETEATLTASEVSIEGTRGPAVLAMSRGTARLRAITGRANQSGSVWAECSQGALVEVDGWMGDRPPTPAPCIRPSAVNPPR